MRAEGGKWVKMELHDIKTSMARNEDHHGVRRGIQVFG